MNTDDKNIKEVPYLITIKTIEVKKYNTKYGDDRVCECGPSVLSAF